MTFRGVLRESFTAYKHEWWTLVPAGFLIYFFVALFSLVVESLWEAGAFIAVAATFLGQLWLTALHVVEANDARAGKPPTRMGETLKSMRGRLKVLLGVYVVGVVALGVFAALLILLPRLGTTGRVFG